MEFTTILSAADTPLLDAFFGIRAQLIRKKFRHSEVLSRAHFNPGSNFFDEASPPDTVRLDNRRSSIEKATRGWRAATVEFWNDDFLLYLLLARSGCDGSSYLNAFVDIEARTLLRLREKSAQDQVFEALVAIAVGCHAEGGLGDLDLSFNPLPPSEIERHFGEITTHAHGPAALGLFSHGSVRNTAVLERWGRTHHLQQHHPGYLLLCEIDSPHFDIKPVATSGCNN